MCIVQNSSPQFQPCDKTRSSLIHLVDQFADTAEVPMQRLQAQKYKKLNLAQVLQSDVTQKAAALTSTIHTNTHAG